MQQLIRIINPEERDWETRVLNTLATSDQRQTNTGNKAPPQLIAHMSRDMWFPTMWHFDKCRLRRACAVSF